LILLVWVQHSTQAQRRSEFPKRSVPLWHIVVEAPRYALRPLPGYALCDKSLVPLVAIATATKRIQLGPGIMPIFLRSPLLTVQSIAQLDEVSEGRAILGLGVSTPALLAPHGVLYGKPLTRMREYMQIVRGLLRGETVSHQGQVYNIQPSQLEFPL